MSVKRTNDQSVALVPASKKTKSEIVAYAAKAKRVMKKINSFKTRTNLFDCLERNENFCPFCSNCATIWP